MGNTERERLFQLAADLGWVPRDPNKKGYVKLVCPCGKHLTWVHKTPSNPYYYDEKIKFITRKKCVKRT